MKNKENIINILGVFVCLAVFTIIPLKTLFPVDFQSADHYHEDQTAFSVNVVNNWLTDGIVNHKFIMFADYDSVEFENNNNRIIYTSYPPGSLIPLYLIAKATGKNEISIGFVKRFVQFEYYLSILFLGLLFYICLQILEIKSRKLMIALPVILSSLWAFLPFNLYYMKNIYFVEEAIIVLSIIFFLIEFALYSQRGKRCEIFLQTLSGLILFVGILTDYYFCTIAFVAFFFRIMNAFQNNPGKPFLYNFFSSTRIMIVAVISAASLFFIQLLSVPDGLKLLAVTFHIRTGSGMEHGGIQLLAIHHFNVGFSVFFLPVLIGVTFFCLIFPFIRNKFDKKTQMIFNWLSIITLSSVLHTAILREHSIIHEFSMLKYNLVFVFIIFSFSCWIYLNNKVREVLSKRKYSSAILILMIILIGCSFVRMKNYNNEFYNKRIFVKKDHSVANFIRANTNYYDVVYSPDYEIYWSNTADLAIAKKRVYKILTPQEVPVNGLPDHAIINLLISEETMRSNVWNKFNANKFRFKKFNNFYFITFSKEFFRSAIN